MPWWAVSASIIATKISALTFIALPAKVFVDGGNLEYGVAIIGFVLGNFLMAALFVRPYYEENIYSPYDFIGKRIHGDVAVFSRLLFLTGTVLSQSVRLLATAVVLHVISGMNIPLCAGLIVVFSILWSILGGVRTVIWTDLILFFIFMGGGGIALYTALAGVDLPLPEMLAILDEKAKLKLIDFSLNPMVTYTLWAGLTGAAVFELGSNAVDQVVTQRIVCCRSIRDAQKAVAVSALSVIPTLLMLAVGLSLVLFFHHHGIRDAEKDLFNPGNDAVFPYFVVHHIPSGLSGLILAGMFASGISTLDSALTALAQTTVVGIRKTLSQAGETADPRQLLKRSRTFIVYWGSALFAIAMIFRSLTQKSGEGLLDAGMRVPGFISGSLLGLAFLALFRKKRRRSALIGAGAGCAASIVLWYLNVGFLWWYPVAAFLTFLIGGGFRKLDPSDSIIDSSSRIAS